MRILSLNTQKAYNLNLGSFLTTVLEANTYDVLLLQEATEEVLAYVRPISGYRMLTATDKVIGKQSLLCIVYRESLALLSHHIQSFSGLRYDPVAGYKHLGFGVLVVIFHYENKEICLSSIHLHSGTDAAIRARELEYLKELVTQVAGSHPLIVAGDFNFGYPWELSRGARLLAPELICITRQLGGTLNSRYSEYANHLPNKVATLFAKIGLGITLKADHFILDKRTAVDSKFSTRMLSERVSDHSPIELIINA